MDINEVRRAFAARVKTAGGYEDVAGAIGCSAAFVRMLENGPQTPGLKLAANIERHLGIGASLWVARDTPKGGQEP